MVGIVFNSSSEADESVKTIVGADTQLEGVIEAEESIRIDGRFKGTVDCTGTLIIGTTADIEADIVADQAVIGGKVRGDIQAREKIQIRNQGEIYGDLTSPVLQIDRGVVLEGNCTINTGGDEEDEDAKVTSIQQKMG